MHSLLLYEGFTEIQDADLRNSLEPVTVDSALVAVIDWYCNFTSGEEASDFSVNEEIFDGLYSITRDSADDQGAVLQWLDEAHRPTKTLPNELTASPVADRTSSRFHLVHVGEIRPRTEEERLSVPPPERDTLAIFKELFVKALQPQLNRRVEGNALRDRIVVRNCYHDEEGLQTYPTADCQPGLIDFCPSSDDDPEGSIALYWLAADGSFLKPPVIQPAFPAHRGHNIMLPPIGVDRRNPDREDYEIVHGGWRRTAAGLMFVAGALALVYYGITNPSVVARGAKNVGEAFQSAYNAAAPVVVSTVEKIFEADETDVAGVESSTGQQEVAREEQYAQAENREAADTSLATESTDLSNSADTPPDTDQDAGESNLSRNEAQTTFTSIDVQEEMPASPVYGAADLSAELDSAGDAGGTSSSENAATYQTSSPTAAPVTASNEVGTIGTDTVASTDASFGTGNVSPPSGGGSISGPMQAHVPPTYGATGENGDNETASPDPVATAPQSFEPCWDTAGTLTCVVMMDGSPHLVPLGKPIKPCSGLSASRCRTDYANLAMR